jgi:hypothetical protein
MVRVKVKVRVKVSSGPTCDEEDGGPSISELIEEFQHRRIPRVTVALQGSGSG